MVETPGAGTTGARGPDERRPPTSTLLDVLGEVDRLAAEVGRLNAELALADAAARTPATRGAQRALDRRYARFPTTSRADARRAGAEVGAARAAAAAAAAAADATDETDARDAADAAARARTVVTEATAGSAPGTGAERVHADPEFARHGGHDESGTTPDRSSRPTGADDGRAEAADRCDGDATVRDAAGAVARARAMVAEATAADAATDRDAARREDLTRWAEQDRAEQNRVEQADDGDSRDRSAS